MTDPSPSDPVQAARTAARRRIVFDNPHGCGNNDLADDVFCSAWDAAIEATRTILPTAASGELVEALREHARRYSAADKMMADAKTARQSDRNDYPEMTAAGLSGYSWAEPEQTVFWQAAAQITTLETTIARLSEGAEGMAAPASRLLAAFDELRGITAAERIVTGRSDRDLRTASNEAISDLRQALTAYEQSRLQPEQPK